MTEEQWTTIRYFRPAEFDSPDAPGSGISMNYEFILALDQIRRDCNFPFHINSGIRTSSHNKNVGGVDSSAHIDGHAADISISNTYQRFLLIANALKQGIQRIGVGNTFVHLDNDPHLPTPRIWTY